MTEVARPAHMSENFTSVTLEVTSDQAHHENDIKTPDSGIEMAAEPVGNSQPPAAAPVVTAGGQNGPDVVLPADSLSTWKCDAPVKLRITDKGLGSLQAQSVISLFRKTVQKSPNTDALCVKRDGQWIKWTFKQYYDDVQKAAKSFIKLGLESYYGVGIIGFNSPEWLISNMSAIFAGGFSVGIYTTNSPEAVHYVAENAKCNIIVVENDAQLQKVLKIRDKLPHLRAIIQYDGKPKQQYDNVMDWKEFLAVGNDVPDSAVEDRIRQMAPNKCCSLIYTSGTTGNPKGVMLSHDNLTFTADVAARAANLVYGQEHLVSYLPLSHIAAQMLDIYMSIMHATTVWFAQPDALKGSLATTLKEVRPTTFFGVPRVYEKMMEKMKAIGKTTTGLKRKIAVWAKGVGYKANIANMNGSVLNGKRKSRRTSVPAGYGIAKKLVFKKIRMALGLDRCKICMTGAAPMSKETMEYFMSLDIPLMELYGMSESSGPHTVNLPARWRMLSVGPDIPGCSTMIDNPDKDGNGEICMGGRHVFMGYLNNEEKTKETIDTQGWLHTGDVGKKDKDDFLYITGRIKELIITAGGENVAPVPIEDIVKEELPCVSNCMLIGDKKKFLALLVTLKTEIDPDTTVPLNQLTPVSVEWCQSVGSNATKLTQVLDTHDEKVLKAIQAGIDRANNRSTSRAQKIQKWSILPRDFSIPGGEIGPTLKLKRAVVSNMYEKTINAFYAET